MLGLGKNAELPQLLVKLFHERGDARLYRAEIVVVQLLTLGRLRAEERSAACSIRSLRFSYMLLSIRKYSCSGPTVVFTRCDVVIAEQTGACAVPDG